MNQSKTLVFGMNSTQSDGMDSCHGLLDKIESDDYNFRIKSSKQKKITDYLFSH